MTKSNTLYRRELHGSKVRYQPVAEETAWDSFPYGTHIVRVSPGSVSRRFALDPETVDLHAMLFPLRDKIIELLGDAVKPTPSQASVPLSPEQDKAWRAFIDLVGDRGRLIAYPSLSSIADQLIESLAVTLAEPDPATQSWLAHSDPVTV